MKWRNDLDDEFSYIPRREVRHDKHLEEKKIWEELNAKARVAAATKKVKRKASNEINN